MKYPSPRKICVITGSRAEYGLLKLLISILNADPDISLQIICTGMHLSPEFGLTYKEIEADGFNINRRIEILLSSDTSTGISKSMGLAMISFAEAFDDLKPDLILVLGDRFEIFSAVSSALISRIPVAHLHGGEVSLGAFDEALRHSITKMSHLHFVATEEYRNRVIQLGENPEKVFLVGGLGVDNIVSMDLLNRTQLEDALGFKFWNKNLLVTFHPATLDPLNAENQMAELLIALDKLEDTKLIFTMPNADTNGRILISMIEKFAIKHPNNTHFFSSLGHTRYLSCLAQVDGVVGNSSSGLLEVPSFKKGTINIGDRQFGRLQAKSVINCEPKFENILESIKTLYSDDFQTQLKSVENPYGKGGASVKIANTIKGHELTNLIKKTFFDLDFEKLGLR